MNEWMNEWQEATKVLIENKTPNLIFLITLYAGTCINNSDI